MSRQMMEYHAPEGVSIFVSSAAFKKLGAWSLKVIGLALEVFKQRAKSKEWRNVDMIVVEPGPRFFKLEDGGITLRVGMPGLPAKVYAKIDDYGPPEKWPELYDPDTVKELRSVLKTRFTLTVILPEEW